MSKSALPKRSLYRKAAVDEFDTTALNAEGVSTKTDKLAVARQAVNAVNADAVNDAAVVNALQQKKARIGSKHPPGYMTQYMRKRRAK